MITEVFRLAFASQFNTLNAQDFCAKKSDGNSALSNQHLVQGRDKRIAFLNETSRAKGQEWNAQAIKVFSNGGGASRVVSTTTVRPSASSTNRPGSAT